MRGVAGLTRGVAVSLNDGGSGGTIGRVLDSGADIPPGTGVWPPSRAQPGGTLVH